MLFRSNMTSEYQNAVAYQLYHALELFIKYAIQTKKGSVSKIHDLSKLFEEYDRLYPHIEFRLSHPFDFSNYEPSPLNRGELESYKDHIKKFSPSIMDQHLRYPPDEKTGGYSYSIDSDTFTQMKSNLLKIYGIINC